jgi:hypothetical protein
MQIPGLWLGTHSLISEERETNLKKKKANIVMILNGKTRLSSTCPYNDFLATYYKH